MVSDELNRPEVARLKAREADIRQEKRATKSDGVVTCDERQDIRQDEPQPTGACRDETEQAHHPAQKARLAAAYAPAAAQNKASASNRDRQARCAKEMN